MTEDYLHNVRGFIKDRLDWFVDVTALQTLQQGQRLRDALVDMMSQARSTRNKHAQNR